MKRISALVVLMLAVSPALFGQNSDCFDCHSDNELTISRNGNTVSLFVNENNYNKSVHGSLECIDCHEDFDAEEMPHREGENIYKVSCGNCHDEYVESNKKSIHFRLGDKVKNPPNCITCHGKHDIVSPSKVRNKVKTYCSQCHDGNVVLANKYHQIVVDNSTCADCHETKEYKTLLSESIHSNLNCSDCHNYISNNLDDHPDNINKSQRADCYLCHNDVAAIHRESIHGISLKEGIDEAAQCWDCHGSHMITKADDEKSQVNPKNISATCSVCHDNPNITEKYNIPIPNPGELYSMSVHGKNVAEGGGAANCTSCHGIHDIQAVMHPKSKISPYNISKTCGECHSDIEEDYEQSIHWIRAKKGERFSPVCNDCHSEHEIKAVNGDGEDAVKEKKKLQQETCFECHESNILAKRYGKNMGQPSLYQDSYHGLAVMRGDDKAAMCIDCHGVHKILPSSFEESKVSNKNLVSTCQKCHPEATEIFSQSYSHRSTSEKAAEVEGIVSNIYFWMIVFVIGGMVAHNLIIFFFEITRKRRKEKNVIILPRFTKNEVVQHLLLLTSFIVLVITGFALKFPNSFWASWLVSLGLSEPIRQIIHRTSGVVMLVLGFYHIGYLLFTSRGRDVLKELVPNFDDIKQVSQNLMYYLRLSKKHPHFNQYDYAEKAEYWALIWGTFVMGVTGFILWFPTIVGDWAPVWFIKVAEIIHYYEAILASLAILVWHWFFVLFHPKEYPMSFTWIDGKISLSHYRSHHENHFRRLLFNWHEYKESGDPKVLTNYTKLVFNTFEKNGFETDNIFQNELNNDPELRLWLDDQVENNSNEKK